MLVNAEIKYIKLDNTEYVLKTNGVTKIEGTSWMKALEKAKISPITISYEEVISSVSGCKQFNVLGISRESPNGSLKIMIDCKKRK